MTGSRNTIAAGHDADGPGAASRFALAYERLAAEDEERSRWLTEHCRARPAAREEDEVCSIAGCEKPSTHKGLCHAHYMAEWRKAHPRSGQPKAQGDRCRRGHVYDHTRTDKAGNVFRVCRECRRQRERKRREQAKAGAPLAARAERNEERGRGC